MVQLINQVGAVVRSKKYPEPLKHVRTKRFVKVMAKVAFDEHVPKHGALLGRLVTIIGGPVSALCDDLKAWFVDHVHGYEADLKAIFQAAAA